MKQTMKKSVMTCLAAFLFWGAMAQEAVVKVDLETAIGIALDENPTIKVANMEIERQKYVRRETIGNHLPQVSATGSYSRAIKKSDMGGGLSFDADNTVSGQASIALPLFAPGVYKTLKLNDEQMRAAVEDARGSKITLTNEVSKSYYNILLAEESLAVLKSSEATVSKTVEDVKTKYESGLASEYDYITASVQLSNLRPQIIQTENAIETSKKMLKMYMGLPLSTKLEVSGSLNDFALVSTRNIFEGASDISGNNELRSMDIQLSILERTLDVQRTQRLPTVSGFGNFSLSGRDPLNLSSAMGGGGNGTTSYDGVWAPMGSDGKPDMSQATPLKGFYIPSNLPVAPKSSDKFLWTYPISAGVNISIPIFSGLTRANKEKQIKNNISQMELQRDYLEESVNVQIQNSMSAVITADSKMQANKATIGQAQKGYDISLTRYDAGMGTMLEVNTAELQLTQAKLNYTQAIYDYLSAQADYDKLLGKEKINQ